MPRFSAYGDIDLNKVNPTLVQLLRAGSEWLPEGYSVVVTSGDRPNPALKGSRHKGGGALDVEIVDPKGNRIPNEGPPGGGGIYRQLAHGVYNEAAKISPELASQVAWGGEFESVPGKSGLADYMHFDLGGRRGQWAQEGWAQVAQPAAARAPIPLDRGGVTPLAGTNVPAGRTGLTAEPTPLYAPQSQLHGAPVPNPFADKTAAVAQKYNIPHSVFEGLIRAESGFNPKALGGSGEIGLGQLLPSTAKELGVVDPHDIDQNLDATGRYLSDQYKRTGSWSKALSAYNRGPTGAERSGYSLDRYNRSPAGQSLIELARSTDASATGGPSGLEIKPPGQAALPAPPVDPLDPEPQFQKPRAYTRPSAISPDPIDPEPQPRPSFMDPTPQDQKKPPGFRPSAPGEGTPLSQGMKNWNSAQMLMALLNKGTATAQSIGPHYDPQAIAAATTGAPARMEDPWIAGAPRMRVRVGAAANKAMQTVE